LRDASAFLVFIPDKAAVQQFQPLQRQRCKGFFLDDAACVCGSASKCIAAFAILLLRFLAGRLHSALGYRSPNEFELQLAQEAA
jgi:hypothetical protein